MYEISERGTVLQLWLSKGRRTVCVDQVLVKWWFRENGDHLSWKGLSLCIKSVRLWIVQSVLPCYPRLDKYWVSRLTPSVKVPPHPHPPIFPLLSTVGLWCPRWVVAEYFFKDVTISWICRNNQIEEIIKIYIDILKGCVILWTF